MIVRIWVKILPRDLLNTTHNNYFSTTCKKISNQNYAYYKWEDKYKIVHTEIYYETGYSHSYNEANEMR